MQTGTNPAASTADSLLDSDYATKSRRLLEASKTLRDLGGQELFDIPRIVVIGGQSAGKSSLVEAVTGIRVPRDSGTCTRCPMEVNLTSKPGTWTCRISLRIEFEADGQRAPSTQLLPFGPDLTNPELVELSLRRAQVAILCHYNASAPLESFLNKSKTDLQNMYQNRGVGNIPKFTKNTIVVDISEENGTDLSFVDLPGLVQNQENDVVLMVEDLVRENIKGNSLILVTIPMSDDMENQRSMRLALEADEDKNRTIGVLTKPDMLTAGATGQRQKWHDLLAGKDNDPAHSLRLGFYCVKLPEDASRNRNLTRDQRRREEMEFFSTRAEGRELRTGTEPRCGVHNLVRDLSKLLTEMLGRLLPEMKRKASAKHSEHRNELRSLGEPTQDGATTRALNLVRSFISDLDGMVKGSDIDVYDQNIITDAWWNTKRTFVMLNRKRYVEYKHEIRHTAPHFVPLLSKHPQNAFSGMNVDEDIHEFKKPHEAESVDDSIQSDPGEEHLTGVAQNAADDQPRGHSYNLEHVRDLIQKCMCWEFPNEVPRRVKRELIREFTAMWKKPTEECFESIAQALKEALDLLVRRHFSEFPKMLDHMDGLVGRLFDEYKVSALAQLMELLELESFPMFTQNDAEFNSESENWLAKYRVVRRLSEKGKEDDETPFPWVPLVNAAATIAKHGLSLSTLGNAQEIVSKIELLREMGVRISNLAGASAGASDSGYESAGASDDGTVVDSMTEPDFHDEFERELRVMADVRAYFQIAYKRVVDYVPLKIEHSLNRYVGERMFGSLMENIGFNDGTATNSLEQLLAEDPRVTQRRTELKDSVASYEVFLKQLRFFSLN